jgi:hypothetical protein
MLVRAFHQPCYWAISRAEMSWGKSWVSWADPWDYGRDWVQSILYATRFVI